MVLHPIVQSLVNLGPELAFTGKKVAEEKDKLNKIASEDLKNSKLGYKVNQTIEEYLAQGLYLDVAFSNKALRHRNALLKIITVNDMFEDRDSDKSIGKANYFNGLDNKQAKKTKKALVDQYLAEVDANYSPEVAAVAPTQAVVALGFWSV